MSIQDSVKEKDKIEAIYREHVTRFIKGRQEAGSRGSLLPEELDEIWEEVSSELDIGDAWLQISSGLDKTLPPHHGPGLFQKYCAAVILILSVLIYVEKTIPEPDAICQETSTELKVKEQPKDLVTGRYSDELTGDYDSYPVVQPPASAYESGHTGNGARPVNSNKISVGSQFEMNPARDLQLTPVANVLEEDQLATLTGTYLMERTGNQPLNSQACTEIPVLVYIADNGSLKPGRPAATENPMHSPVKAGRFSGGVITSYKNTWLLSRETFNGLRSESLNTTELVLFPDAGLSLGYMFTEKLTIQAEAYLYSSTGQEYHDYIFGRYARKKIVLRYSTLALRTKYRITGQGFIPDRSSFSFTAGGYLSFLDDANQVINNEISKIRSDYKRYDFGIMAGGEFELNLNEYLSVAPGLNLTLGLTNIYKGTGNNPGYPGRTHNGSAGFQLSFYYHFE